MCYKFDSIIKTEDFEFDILIDEKSHENILIYNISYKALVGAKPLRIRFRKTDGFIRWNYYNWAKYLLFFGSAKYDTVYIRIRYLICEKGLSNMLFLIIMQEL